MAQVVIQGPEYLKGKITMRRIVTLVFSIGFVLLTASQGIAADAVGKVTYIRGDAWLARGEQKLDISLNADIFSGDSVITEGSGRVRLAMADDSVIYVGQP